MALPRQTLARWVELAADWLRPIYEFILTGVLGGGYVQIDETPIRYLAPGNGQTKQGYLWMAHRPRGDAVYRWETTRAATCLEKIVPIDFTGTIQCDGDAGYGAFANRRPSAITLKGSRRTACFGIDGSGKGSNHSFSARWDQVDGVRAANALIEAHTRTDARLAFIDVFPKMLGANGEPRPEIYLTDRLHMNVKGYELWRGIVGPVLDRWPKTDVKAAR